MQRQTLVPKTDVQRSIFGELIGAGKSPQAEPVIERDGYDGFPNCYRLFYDEGKIVTLVRTASVLETPAVDPESYGELLVGIACGAHDVQIQAILGALVEGLVKLACQL